MPKLTEYDTLILEGGSLRCAFSAGVMDALMLLGPMSFERTIGASAGSMVMASYLSGQYKHFVRIARDLVDDGQFIRFSSAWSEEGLMNLAHLKAHVLKHAPLDLEALEHMQKTTRAEVVLTRAQDGTPMYVQPQGERWLDALMASSALPMLTRGRAQWDQTWVFDGGYSDALPLQRALDLGGRRILVVRTRPVGDHIAQSTVDYLASYWYWNEVPQVLELFEKGHEGYNAVVDRLRLGGDGEGRHWEEIAPPFPLKSDSLSVRGVDVMSDYRLGVEQAMNWWARK